MFFNLKEFKNINNGFQLFFKNEFWSQGFFKMAVFHGLLFDSKKKIVWIWDFCKIFYEIYFGKN